MRGSWVRTARALLAALAIAACSKDAPSTGGGGADAGLGARGASGGDAGAAGSASTGSGVSGAPGASDAGQPAASSGGAAGASATYKGSYESSVGTFPLPANKDYDGLKWRGEKSELGLGKGEISLTLPPGARGVVIGTLDGPLGPAVIRGYLDGDDVTARFDAKEAAPERFAGGLVGKRKGDTVEGTLDAAQDSKVLRSGPFSLKLTR